MRFLCSAFYYYFFHLVLYYIILYALTQEQIQGNIMKFTKILIGSERGAFLRTKKKLK